MWYVIIKWVNIEKKVYCFQMYWTKATTQKYSDQSQHQTRFKWSAETKKDRDKKILRKYFLMQFCRIKEVQE